ncbi:acyltransferase, partial [Bacteroidales bacterium OttesenSCG-928-A17]|nr:acyltransferase [Bacteroidales bacterium OttesenSCG-928-A17]
YNCCKHIFLFCGKNVNIERKAYFGSGLGLEIGDRSGIGVNAVVPNNIKIGMNVMMGPNCYILSKNHEFSRIDIPMIEQSYSKSKQTIIEDDVWIGRQVLFTPGRTVKKGSIIAAGTILSKDFEEYSIIGGNPSRLIRKRI